MRVRKYQIVINRGFNPRKNNDKTLVLAVPVAFGM